MRSARGVLSVRGDAGEAFVQMEFGGRTLCTATSEQSINPRWDETFVLVVHEASHEMFVLAADRALSKRLNRAFGWSVAIFFATHYGKHWERGHLEHHVRPLEPGDPQSHNVLLGRKLLTRVLCNVFIPGFLFLMPIIGDALSSFVCEGQRFPLWKPPGPLMP